MRILTRGIIPALVVRHKSTGAEDTSGKEHTVRVRLLRSIIVVGAIAFFIAYRFLITNMLWEGREIPPEPDDSFTYISAAEDISVQGEAIPDTVYLPRTSSERVKALPYSIMLVTLAQLTGLEVSTVYHLTFYLGSIIAAFVLFVVLRYLFRDDTLAAVGLVVLALFNGDGAYHGFFWVVPSFFGLIAFFSLLLFLIAPYRRAILLIIVSVPYFILIHPFSLYVLSLFVFYALFVMFLSRHFDQVLAKRAGVLLAVALAFAASFHLFQQVRGIGEGPTAGIPALLEHVVESGAFVNTNSWRNFQALYLDHLFPIASSIPHPPRSMFGSIAAGVLFLLGLSALIHGRERKLLGLFLAVLLFSLLSLSSPFGARSLLYLWPVTFLVLGTSALLLFRSPFPTWIPVSFRVAIVVLLPLFFIGSPVESFQTVHAFNTKAKMPLHPEAIAFLRANTAVGERILFLDKFSQTYIIRGGNLVDRAPIDWNIDWTNPAFANRAVLGNIRYVIGTDFTLEQTKYQQQVNSFLRAYYREVKDIDAPGIWYARHLISVYDIGDTYAFGYMRIYRVNGAVTDRDLRPPR